MITGSGSGYDGKMYVLSNGNAWVQGSNSYGQLGNGGTSDNGPTKAVQTGEGMSDMLYLTGANNGAFILGIKEDGYVWGAGSASRGQLGEGSKKEKILRQRGL